MCRWNSNAQYALHCHGVAAIAPILEETASAMPLSIIVVGRVNIVFALECSFKAIKLNALWFLGVAFGLCDFADDT